MKTFTTLATASLALASSVLASPAKTKRQSSSFPAVTVQGNAFFSGTDRFFVRGVDYQPGGSANPIDPIANAETCKRDIAQFVKLGLNTIRVYTVDNTADHDECMFALQDAGIYLALDVNSGLYSINNANYQLALESYNNVYLQNVFATIDAFAKYNNTLLFFSGNEVVNMASNTEVAPFVKAVTRDMKQYIGERGYRNIPVGYSAADVSQNRYQMAAYMNCGPESARSDFFAFNDYSWCDPNTFIGSGWAAEVELYSNYSIPLFLSEYGCITTPRLWEEVGALYTSEMTAVYSGGLVYEYSNEVGNAGYGLVQINSPTSVTEGSNFTTLMQQFQKYPLPAPDAPYHTGLPPLACPSKSSQWLVSNDKLPAIPAGALQYMKNGAGPGVGFTGSGSQTAGTPSVGYASPNAGAVTATYGSGGVAANTGGSSATGGTTSTGAAASIRIPEFQFGVLYSGVVVVVCSLFGAGLLL